MKLFTINYLIMLLKLIKTRPFISGSHCEVWEINHLTGNRHLGDVFVLNEHLPLELIYRVTVNCRGICVDGKPVGWQWDYPRMEESVTNYLRTVQEIHEEIFIDICQPEPDLPGYPHTDYHPDDYPVVLGLDDLEEAE